MTCKTRENPGNPAAFITKATRNAFHAGGGHGLRPASGKRREDMAVTTADYPGVPRSGAPARVERIHRENRQDRTRE